MLCICNLALCIYVCLTVYLSLLNRIFLFVCCVDVPYLCISICLSVYLSYLYRMFLFVCSEDVPQLNVYLSVLPVLDVSVCLQCRCTPALCIFICLSVYLSHLYRMFLFVCTVDLPQLCVYLSVCLYICLTCTGCFCLSAV